MAYYAIALTHDMLPVLRAQKLRDYVFAALAVPLAFETSLMYWSLCSIDRELAFPKALDEFFPRWLDIVLHTNVSIFIIIEMIMVHHQYPRRLSAVRGLTLFITGYLFWVYVIYVNTGKWVYGVIGVLSAPQRIIFFVSCGLVTVSFYFIGEVLNKLLSGSEKGEAKKKAR